MKVIDIETVPQEGIMNTWYPMWVMEKNAAILPSEEIEKRAALYPEFGMICAIGISEPGGKPTSCTARDFAEERSMLLDLRSILGDSETLVGHNLKSFDIPFLAKRYMFHDLEVPKTLRVLGKKPWDINHIDTMELMKFRGGMSMSLRSACFLLGLKDPKLEVSGDDVFKLFKQKDMLTIASYVEGDVKATYEVFKKLKNLAL